MTPCVNTATEQLNKLKSDLGAVATSVGLVSLTSALDDCKSSFMRGLVSAKAKPKAIRAVILKKDKEENDKVTKLHQGEDAEPTADEADFGAQVGVLCADRGLAIVLFLMCWLWSHAFAFPIHRFSLRLILCF